MLFRSSPAYVATPLAFNVTKAKPALVREFLYKRFVDTTYTPPSPFVNSTQTALFSTARSRTRDRGEIANDLFDRAALRIRLEVVESAKSTPGSHITPNHAAKKRVPFIDHCL